MRIALDARRQLLLFLGAYLVYGMSRWIAVGDVSVVSPLRLDELGWGALGISAVFLVSAGIEAALNPFIGRWSDRYGRLAPVRAGLVALGILVLVVAQTDPRPALHGQGLVVLVALAGMLVGAVTLLFDE